MIDIVVQAGIFLFGASAVWVVAQAKPWRRWGYILGLCGQPFWVAMAVKDGVKWGVLALVVWYTYSWSLGVRNHWIRPTAIPGHSRTEQ